MKDVCAQISEEFSRTPLSGTLKHVRLRETVLSVIRNGLLKPGDQIPPEQVLSGAVGLSLGTVQKALTDLAAEGALVREQGRGTFVAQARAAIGEVWQYRFVERPGGPLLPIDIELLRRRKVNATGPWLGPLGADGESLCEMTRRVIVNRSFVCLSRFYVSIKRFPALMKIPTAELNLNLKVLLAEKFGEPTLSIDQFIAVTEFDDDSCNYLGLPKATRGIAQHSLGKGVAGQVTSYQYLAIPAGGYLLQSPSGKDTWSNL
jgi:DNA-binding GntR family transcriptional regulator